MMGSCRMRFLGGVSAAVMACAVQPALAQTTDEPREVAAEDEVGRDIVVTGTLLRGVAPVGTNVVTLSRADLDANGGKSANDLLTRVPQVSSAFLSTPTTSSSDSGLSVVRPNIRDLGASGTNTTLVIMDGHRLVGAGVLQSTPDPDIVPPSALEQVDVVPDGGSSIYGSDAIGGVINYITRRKFDGLEMSVRYGFADAYETVDLNITTGKDWGSGSAYLSYAFAANDAVLGKDRDYQRQITPNQGYCPPGTILANGTTYALPGRAAGTMTACDLTDNNSFWPDITRYNLFASVSQDVGEAVSLDLKGYYAHRDLTHFLDLTAVQPQTLTITSTNPYFRPVAGETSQTVRTSFQGVIDNQMRNSLTSLGVTPTLTARLGGGWQLRALGNYGQSRTLIRQVQIDASAAVAGTTAATALNPYNLAGNSQAVLNSVQTRQRDLAHQYLYNARAIVDGPLFSLPGGEVRLAAGAEYIKEKYDRTTNGVETGRQSRDVTAYFGEIVLPVVGADNRMGGIHSLTFSASARYDDYSAFGGTFNPKVGVTYEPTSWARIRGNWGKSFNAPSIIDATGGIAVGGLPSGAFSVPGQTSPWAVIIAGNTGKDMRPQTADTWSLGADIQPVSGLKLSATYYNLHLKDVIGLLFGAPVLPELQPFIRENVSCASTQAQFASAQSFLVPLSTVCAVSPTVAVYDYRVQNLGVIKQDGIDFSIDYRREVGFGSVRGGIAGTYTLNRDVARTAGASFREELDTPGRSRLGFVGSAGATVGDLSADMFVNHRGGYDLNPAIPGSTLFAAQSEVGSFTTVDLFLSYALPDAWLGRNASLSLTVNNLFDQDPPFYNGCVGTTTCGYTNGSTLGRLIQFGVRTKF